VGRVNVIRSDGTVVSVEERQVGALERLGYRREQAPEAETRAKDDATKAYYDTYAEKAKALGEGVLNGVTLGVSELLMDDEESREREEHLGGYKLAGEIGGAVGSVLATGGSGLTGTVARATPAAKAALAGERVAAKVGGGKAAKLAVEGVVEGGLSGAGMTAATVLTDSRPDTIESFVSEVGLGTLFSAGLGGGIGGALGGATELGKKAAARLAKVTEAAEEAPRWKGDAAERLKQRVSQHFDAAHVNLGHQKEMGEAEFARWDGIRGRLEADLDGGETAKYTNEIEELLVARKAVDPLDLTEIRRIDKRIVRLGNEMMGDIALLRAEPEDLIGKVDAQPAVGAQIGEEAKTGAGKLKAEPVDPNATGPAKGKLAKAKAALKEAELSVAKGQDVDIPALKAHLDEMAEFSKVTRDVQGGAKAKWDVPGAVPDPKAAPVRDYVADAKKWDDMTEAERLAGEHGEKAAQAVIQANNLKRIRERLSNPETFAKQSPEEVFDTLWHAKIAFKNAPAELSAIRQSYGAFLEDVGLKPQMGGLTPADIAAVAKVRPGVWDDLDSKDMEFLAAWAAMRAGPAKAPVPVSKYDVDEGNLLDGEQAKQKKGLVHQALRYLGGKVLMGASGGGWGAFFLGSKAVDVALGGRLGQGLSGARQQVAKRIDESLVKLTRASSARSIRSASGPLMAAAISPEKYEEASREIHSLAGAGGRESLYMATAGIRAMNPDLADSIIEDGMRRVSYLSKVLPKPPPQALFRSTRWAPSPVDRAKVGGIVRVVTDPAYALEAMADQRLTHQMANAFRETSPALFNRVAATLVTYAEQHPDAPGPVRRQIAILLGIPGDNLQLYTAQLQAGFGGEPPGPGPAQTARSPMNQPTAAQELTER
jgi:hypothetical protein